MRSAFFSDIWFPIWWILVNGYMYHAEYVFLLRFTNVHGETESQVVHRKINRRIVGAMLFYIGINCALTLMVLCFRISGFLPDILHTLLLCLFTRYYFKCKWSESVAPAAVIFTLTAFMTGISSLLMSYLSKNLKGPELGNVLYGGLTLLLAVLFSMALRLIAGRYQFTAGQPISYYLYILLLPCVLTVWVLRFGLGLNAALLPPENSNSIHFLLWALVGFTGALIMFFLTIKIFGKIVVLGNQETEKALLNEKLREQQIYVAEAKKRDEQYRSFQHDINNHLLILSGLVGEESFTAAKDYVKKLYKASESLSPHLSTGNSVLDILLREKTGYARQNGILTDCSINLPEHLSIEDMDLCVIFSNALDNAITACMEQEKDNKHIVINAGLKHSFLVMEVSNSFEGVTPVTWGTGLKNIRRTAEKYRGTMEIRQENSCFQLSILLCLNEAPTKS